MKRNKWIYLVAVIVGFFFVVGSAMAQEVNPGTTQFSYKVDFGPVYPIEGTSNQLTGTLGLSDTNGELEKLTFTVPLISFIGTHPGYLSWIGNAWTNPDMRFRSSSITKKEDHYEVDGTLEFRRRYAPIKINLYRRNVGEEIVLEGDFSMNTRDYFLTPPPVNLVPVWIPMKFTMVFDKPKIGLIGGSIHTHDS